ncbi:MAG: tyrosine-type recombinase/integrase [Clostridia bacterium]|nr:tyrosine-type recombinase/integrase [Clostridia bacterium]
MRLPNGYGSVVKLSGKRRNPYVVRKTAGWRYDKDKDKQVQEYIIIGYAPTKAYGLQMLAEYNKNPFDVSSAKITFQEIFEKWSASKFPSISDSNVKGYNASYKLCGTLYNKVFKEIKLADLQYVVDTCYKNYPTLRKLKVLFGQLYEYALKNDVCNKNYAEFVDIVKYKDRNPNKRDKNKFDKYELERIWAQQEDKYYQIVLMLIYSGVRISEMLDLLKSDVRIEEQYFDVIDSKTKNGIRKVPIADKVLPFFKNWYNDTDSEYLLHTENGEQFKYRNYYDSYFVPLMENLSFDKTTHCCRHTCISMLAEAHVEQTTIKKIVGHSGAMTLTEKVYTHLDVKELIDAINKI